MPSTIETYALPLFVSFVFHLALAMSLNLRVVVNLMMLQSRLIYGPTYATLMAKKMRLSSAVGVPIVILSGAFIMLWAFVVPRLVSDHPGTEVLVITMAAMLVTAAISGAIAWRVGVRHAMFLTTKFTGVARENGNPVGYYLFDVEPWEKPARVRFAILLGVAVGALTIGIVLLFVIAQ